MRIDAFAPDVGIVREAGKILAEGGIVLHATETVYGLACRWDNLDSINRLATLKKRDFGKPNSIMIGDFADIADITGGLSPRLNRFLEAVLPGPLTVVVPLDNPRPDPYWGQFASIGFRFPDHPLSRELIRAAGVPLITTSANIAGDPSPAAESEISRELAASVDLFLPSGNCPVGLPSTVIEISKNENEVFLLRKGAVDFDSISNIWIALK